MTVAKSLNETPVAVLEADLAQARSQLAARVAMLHDRGLQASTLDDGLHAAIVLKESGNHTEAASLFDHLAGRWPDQERLVFEYLQFRRRLGDHPAADRLLTDAVDRGLAGDDLTREAIVRSLVDPPADPTTQLAVQRALLLLLSRSRQDYVAAIANYLAQKPIGSYLATNDDRALLSPELTYERCLSAVMSGTPFCLIRLGDGEGAFVRQDDTAPEHAPLFLQHRRFFAQRWYGDPDLATNSAFLAIAHELRVRLVEADIVGLPNTDWLRHEVSLRNLRTLVNCYELAELVTDAPMDLSGCLTTTTIMVDLEFRGLVTRLLVASRRVVLITSHPGLAAALESRTGVQVTAVFRVPPAESDLDRTGLERLGSHFRDVFPGVRKRIEELPPGTIVLVSAGFLGKLYALDVKRAGGLAFDIGSLSDLWLGHATRPAFEGLGNLRL